MKRLALCFALPYALIFALSVSLTSLAQEGSLAVGPAPVMARQASGPSPTLAPAQSPCLCASGGICSCDDCQCEKAERPVKSVLKRLQPIDAAVVGQRRELPRGVAINRATWLGQVDPGAAFVVNIEGPTALSVGDMGVFTVGGSTAKRYGWLCIPATPKFQVDSSNLKAYLPGDGQAYTLVLVGIDGESLALDSHPVGSGPGPTPPGPTPTPVPPGPSGLRVLILREAGDNYDRQTLVTLNSRAIREYLLPRVAKAADGKTPEFRTWDDDYTAEQMAFVQDHWRKLYDQAKKDSAGRTPWIVIQDGSRGESRALPKTEAEALELLKKYGGP